MIVSKVIDMFLSWNERHRAAATVRFYKSRLRLFRKKFATREFRLARVDAHDDLGITPLEIDEYLHVSGFGPDGEPLSDSTRRHNVVALESLQSFAVTEKLLGKEERIFEDLEKPRMGQRDLIPTDPEIEKLLAIASPAFVQIYNALCQSGCRPGELCRLTIADVDWHKRLITLADHKTARKTGKPRLIPIGEKFGELLKKAIGRRTWGPVFRNNRRQAWSPNALSAAYRNYNGQAGLNPRYCLYLTRHRFGTRLAKIIGVLKTAKLMGHANINTTQRYIHTDVTEFTADQDLV
jgi:integrase